MKQTKIDGKDIQEYTARSNEIQHDLEVLLASYAYVCEFNWTAPLHDIVRRLMNEVHEFKPQDEPEP